MNMDMKAEGEVGIGAGKGRMVAGIGQDRGNTPGGQGRTWLKGCLAIALCAGMGLAFADEAQLKPDSALVQGCAACHGADGNSQIPSFPSLAGQRYGYLLQELDDFKSHARKDATMDPVVAGISQHDLERLAKYWSEQKPVVPPRAAGVDDALIAEGKELYQTEHGVPLSCEDCHGVDGRGTGLTVDMRAIPALADQDDAYMVAELEKYAHGSITRGFLGMRRVSRNLSEHQIKALAAYLSTMPR
jgi:cytochrome c553